MANKDRNKRSARKARAEERARVEAARAASEPESDSKNAAKKDSAKAKEEKKAEKEKRKKDKESGLFSRMRSYLSDVASEMHRVVWPSRVELKSYSVAVVIMLIVVGAVLWLVDSGIVAGFVAYTGLRG